MSGETSEVERLQAEIVAKETKIRELEDIIANCQRRGVRLRDVVDTYGRGETPSAAQMEGLG